MRRSQWSSVLAGSVVVAAGFAIGIVELLRLPKGTVWLVVAVAVGVIALIRVMSGR